MASRVFNSIAVRTLRHRLEAAVFQIVVWIVPRLPRGMVRALANSLGNAGYFICGEDRNVAITNLNLAFSDSMPLARKKRIAREAFRNLARTLFDLIWASKASPEAMLRLIEYTEPGIQHIRDLLTAKEAPIIIIPHFGNWELGGIALGATGINVTTIAEPGTNPYIDEMITRARRHTGHRIVPPRNAMLSMVRAAARGQPVAVFIDVNARRGRGGIWVDFFGLPVYQSVAAAELAIRSNGTIVCSLPRSMPDGRVKVEFPAFISAADTVATDHAEKVRELSEKMLHYYEIAIRESPEQWLWTYKRWKRRPTEELGEFPRYSKYYAEEEPASKPEQAEAKT